MNIAYLFIVELSICTLLISTNFNLFYIMNTNNAQIIAILSNNILNELIQKTILSYGLLGGDFGKLLFIFYASAFLNDERTLSNANILLDKLLSDMRQNNLELSYCNGIAGLCKGLELLDSGRFINLSTDTISKMMPFLYFGIDDNLRRGNIDYLHGAVGIGRYLLSKWDTDKTSRLYAIKLCEWLMENAIYNKLDECYWLYKSPDNTMSMNNSLSHGLSGTVLFLCQFYDKLDQSILKKRTHSLLRHVANHMYRNLHHPRHIGSFSDSFCIEKSSPKYRSRLAWCYGDLGYAMALGHLAKRLDDNTLFSKAHEVVLFSAIYRRDLSTNGIKDGGLCHGSAGISLFFDYFSTLFNDLKIKEAAAYWNLITPNFFTECKGIPMFGAYSIDSKEIIYRNSLIDGDSGIGLMLMNHQGILKNMIIYDEE